MELDQQRLATVIERIRRGDKSIHDDRGCGTTTGYYELMAERGMMDEDSDHRTFMYVTYSWAAASYAQHRMLNRWKQLGEEVTSSHTMITLPRTNKRFIFTSVQMLTTSERLHGLDLNTVYLDVDRETCYRYGLDKSTLIQFDHRGIAVL